MYIYIYGMSINRYIKIALGTVYYARKLWNVDSTFEKEKVIVT